MDFTCQDNGKALHEEKGNQVLWVCIRCAEVVGAVPLLFSTTQLHSSVWAAVRPLPAQEGGRDLAQDGSSGISATSTEMPQPEAGRTGTEGSRDAAGACPVQVEHAWCGLHHHLNTDVGGGFILNPEVLTVVPLGAGSPLVLFLLGAAHQEEPPEAGPSGHVDLEGKAPLCQGIPLLGLHSTSPLSRGLRACLGAKNSLKFVPFRDSKRALWDRVRSIVNRSVAVNGPFLLF